MLTGLINTKQENKIAWWGAVIIFFCFCLPLFLAGILECRADQYYLYPESEYTTTTHNLTWKFYPTDFSLSGTMNYSSAVDFCASNTIFSTTSFRLPTSEEVINKYKSGSATTDFFYNSSTIVYSWSLDDFSFNTTYGEVWRVYVATKILTLNATPLTGTTTGYVFACVADNYSTTTIASANNFVVLTTNTMDTTSTIATASSTADILSNVKILLIIGLILAFIFLIDFVRRIIIPSKHI